MLNIFLHIVWKKQTFPLVLSSKEISTRRIRWAQKEIQIDRVNHGFDLLFLHIKLIVPSLPQITEIFTPNAKCQKSNRK